LIFEPQGKRLIYDWKTSRKQPKREFMQQRLQTRIYPYILTQAHYPANEKPAAEDIQMIYWYPNSPKLPISFQYNQAQQTADEQYLLSLVDEIQKQNDPIFPLTLDLKQCKFCVYRSLCERGDKPGSFSELEEMDGLTTDISSDWDFESIPEIAF
jgi:CRISPR/Cas system-associated exonuclease Cas4 (RecB family)